VKELKRVWKEFAIIGTAFCLLVVIGFQESERWRQKECLTRDRRRDQVLGRPCIYISIWLCVCVSCWKLEFGGDMWEGEWPFISESAQ
jgi:hypothetical protein